ncbi:MAG: peptide-N4-asparagine amidase [Dokdonella sp.]
MPCIAALVGAANRRLGSRLIVLALSTFPPALFAGGGGGYGPLPAIGSSNVSIADPTITRPSTIPCTVPLFTDFVFNDYSPHDFTYTPPVECAGPWAKVVLSFDLSVTAGIQFDRTGTVWIGGINVFFGTTAEPSPTLAPSWHVERDLTDYSAVLMNMQAGDVFIGNIVNGTYTGVIHGSASLAFYPASASDPAPATADQVLPLGSDPAGATVDLTLPTDVLSKTLTLPTNIERAYLDVFAQSQGSDEFWWSCMPDAVAAITGDCPGTAFREVELSLDGVPAGVAPVYPWVYTGGFQPLLWIPIPGLQTLNFKPYRVDLSPFAAVLSDGAAHTISLSVFNVHEHFSTTAALLLYLDAGSNQVTGSVTTNTIGSGPVPVVTSTIGSDGLGAVTVDSNRQFTLAGHVDTSHGGVDTSIEQAFAFHAVSAYASVSVTRTLWTVDLATNVDTTTTVTTSLPASTRTVHEQLAYPFSLVLPYNPQNGSLVSADFDQQFNRTITAIATGTDSGPVSTLTDRVSTHYESALANRHSEQDYEYTDSAGGCYSRDITSAANKLATVTDAVPCLIAADTIFADGFDGTN